MSLTTSHLKLTASFSRLVRKSGLFYKRETCLDEVVEVLSINRDAVTSDEIKICFIDAKGKKFFISESDENFKVVIGLLASKFRGIEDWQKVGDGPALEHRFLKLWCAQDST